MSASFWYRARVSLASAFHAFPRMTAVKVRMGSRVRIMMEKQRKLTDLIIVNPRIRSLDFPVMILSIQNVGVGGARDSRLPGRSLGKQSVGTSKGRGESDHGRRCTGILRWEEDRNLANLRHESAPLEEIDVPQKESIDMRPILYNGARVSEDRPRKNVKFKMQSVIEM